MSTPPPIFHIGYHKTATTWFQERLYPSVTNAAMIPRDRVRDLLILPRAFEFDVEPVRQELARAPRRPVLCHEELSGNIHNGGLLGCLTAEVARRLYAVDPEAQIVIMVRNQVDLVDSAYRQYIRVGGTHGIDRYLDPRPYRPNRAPLFDLGHLDYRLTIEHYVALFGRRRVSVHLYEDLRDDSEGFVSAFLTEHGLEANVTAIDHRARLAGYGDRLLPVARTLNRFSREELPFKHYLVHVPDLHGVSRRWLDRLSTTAPLRRRRVAADFLGPEHVEAIEQRFGASNRRLAEAFDLDLERHGYPFAE